MRLLSPLIVPGLFVIASVLVAADPSEKDRADLSKRELSARGDQYFFSGKFTEAVADYNAMCERDPDLEDSHWRRGIAWYYAGEYQKAAGQFERYHSFDNVDRENGIWRYFSQLRAYGEERAQKDLLKYEKDDREPFPLLYQLFAGKVTGDEILKQIGQVFLSDLEREKRLFYAELYIGLNYAAHDEDEKAIPHLKRAVANEWAPEAGYGPHYMWQVGRVQLELLTKREE
ncbi:MAG: hypothetical protein CMJ46_08540 [Planctomyces sp.]|nr:hypothetical protein [Planctomyces sp.]